MTCRMQNGIKQNVTGCFLLNKNVQKDTEKTILFLKVREELMTRIAGRKKVRVQA